MSNFILKGNICYSKNKDEIYTIKNGYVVVNEGLSCGVYDSIPVEYKDYELIDYSNKIIIPGLIDLHIHAPQYAFRGLGMDYELIEWLNKETFLEESKYKDLDYADKAYSIFVNKMKNSATSRAVIFATIHRDATILLMEKMNEARLISYVGKINMDRESPDILREKDAMYSAFDTFGWINEIDGKFDRTFPILTPRFIPSCSNELLNELKEIQMTYNIPIQSHLSENPGEVEWVKALRPDSKFYGDAYDKYGLFGKICENKVNTIMAHCIYSSEDEINLISENNVFVAHCPDSNMNLSSGIAPIAKYLRSNINVGLGSDVAGGHTESLFNTIISTIQVSKLYWRYIDQNYKPLTFEEAFYMATIGGGKFFGNVGGFEKGYEFDAIILDDKDEPCTIDLTVKEQLERMVYLCVDKTGIVAKYVKGEKIKLSK